MSAHAIRFLPYVLAFMGVACRLFPLVSAERLYLVFPNDDGYYMLTMARNMALGLGMSVSMGEVPTNGTQPLITGVYAILYWLAGGDKTLGLAFVHFFLTVCACASSYLLYSLAQRLFPQQPWTKTISAWLAAFWFCSPVTLSLSMNTLETGPLILLLLALFKVLVALNSQPLQQQTPTQWVGIGVLLGLLFWTRNDMIFMIAAVACQRLVALLHESELAHTDPVHSSFTDRCGTTLACQAQSSDSGCCTRGRPQSPALRDCTLEGCLR